MVAAVVGKLSAILPWFRAALGHVLFQESTLLILFTWVGAAREFPKGGKKKTSNKNNYYKET